MTTTDRSAFVTVLAWIFIVLGGFSTFIAVLQNLMINLVFPIDEIQASVAAKGSTRLPWYAAFMIENLRIFILSFLLVCVATLVSSIGLLKRLEWARLLFVALMILGIAWNLVGLAFSFVIFSGLPVAPRPGPGFPAGFGVMMNAMMAVNVLMTVGMAVLFGWIIKRLLSEEIRREFSAA